MVEIPEYGAPKVEEQALPSARMQDSATLANFGGGEAADRATSATTAVGGTAEELARNEYDRANQLAAMSADRQLSEAQTQIQVQASKMLGKDALGAPDYINKAWKDTIQNIQNSAGNRDQAMAIARSANARGMELNKFGQTHASEQIRAFDESETHSYLDASRNAATVNAFDDQKVDFETQRTTAAVEDWAKRNGVYYGDDGKVSQIYQTKLQDTLSQLHKDVISARLDKDDPDGIGAAKEYLADHGKEMDAKDYLAARKQVENSETKQLGADMWQGIQNFQLADGSPDEAKMEAAVMGRDDLTDQRKLQVWQYVKARANEQYVQNVREQQSSDRQFMNDLVNARKQGAPLDQALKLAEKYGHDDYDQSLKTLAVQKVYAPPDRTDPEAFLSLWEKSQDGSLQKQDVDLAFEQGKINEGDHRQLREAWYKGKLENEQPDQKQTWDRVKLLAEEKFGSDKQKRDAYLYDMHSVGRDMQPDELWKAANDKLEKAPGTGWFGSSFNAQPQWKVDIARSDAQNLAWGKVSQDLGRPAMLAIGQGAIYNGRSQWGLGDIDAFAQSFGGYDKIKSGTPANNAMQSLTRRGQLVTAKNVKAVLSRYPDGKY